MGETWFATLCVSKAPRSPNQVLNTIPASPLVIFKKL